MDEPKIPEDLRSTMMLAAHESLRGATTGQWVIIRDAVEATYPAVVERIARLERERNHLRDDFNDYKERLWCALDKPVNIEYIAAVKELRKERDELKAQVERLSAAISWALGEDDSGFRERSGGEGAYWWRTELRARAVLIPNVGGNDGVVR